jgi:acyl-CoA-binding protein
MQQQQANQTGKQTQQRHWVELNAEQSSKTESKECKECPHDTAPTKDTANKQDISNKQDILQDISNKQNIKQDTATKQPSIIEKTYESVASTFEKAAFFIQHGATLNMPHDQQIRLAALLRQATMGDCSGQLPEKEDAKETWQVWCSLNGTSRLDAMKEYIKLLTLAKSDWEDAASKLKSQGECKEGVPCKKSETSHIDISGTVHKTLDTLKTTFDKCVHFVQNSLQLDAPLNNKIHMDALLKQATIGDCKDCQPENECDKKLWTEWCNLKGMSGSDAMKQYIKSLSSAKGEWEECEKFACAASHVSDLMKDLNISEEVQEAEDTGVHGQTLPPQAYIRETTKACTQAKELNIKEKECSSCDSGIKSNIAKGASCELNECEKFARDATKVSGLMKELNIKEDICDSCEGGEAKNLPADAYIRNQAGSTDVKGQSCIAKGKGQECISQTKGGINSELKECEKFANDATKVSSLLKELNIKEETCGNCEGGEGKSLPADAYIRNSKEACIGEQLAARREKELSQKI